MKFKIVYDNNKDILRTRIGKQVITKKEGYGLSELLSKNNNLCNIINKIIYYEFFIYYNK